MNEKKNLDRLFQEKFKDFEVAPPDFVWENIQEKLQEKKKRRVVPLWIRLSGVAALLAVGSIFLTPYFNGIDKGTNPVVTGEGQQASPMQAQPEGGNPQNGNNGNDATNSIVGSSSNGPASNQGTDAVQVATVENGNNPSAESANDTATRSQGKAATGTRKPAPVSGSLREAVAQQNAQNSSHSNRSGRVNREAADKATRQLNEGIAAASSLQNSNTAENNEAYKASREALIKNAAATQGVAEHNAGNSNRTSDTAVAANEGTATQGEAPAAAIDRNIPVTEQAVAETTVDTTSALLPENELEKLQREMLEGKDEEKAVAESDKGKWNIRPQVAPVFYNSMTSGSPIDEQFAGNSKSFDNDLSVGLGIDYAISDRFSIRTGINTVNLSYATNDIEFHASLNTTTANIAPGGSGNNIVVQNPEVTEFIIEDTPTSTFQGAMVQKTGYLEVPLEMSYALVNKKFGIDIIGGVSTLFLNENNVSVVSAQGYRSEIGQAKNLNDVHFSTNVGIGFKYKFWKSFEANFEPTFKYQMNAYSRDAGNFRPYFIGLYSGISFRF